MFDTPRELISRDIGNRVGNTLQSKTILVRSEYGRLTILNTSRPLCAPKHVVHEQSVGPGGNRYVIEIGAL